MHAINPRRTVLPSVRVTAEELAAIKASAARARLTVSDYVRARLLKKDPSAVPSKTATNTDT